jgi:hypothetical protein
MTMQGLSIGEYAFPNAGDYAIAASLHRSRIDEQDLIIPMFDNPGSARDGSAPGQRQ